MGMESFYINLRINKEEAVTLLEEYHANNLYQNAFSFSLYKDDSNSEFGACITSLIDNFLPANCMIYKFLSFLKLKQTTFSINTRKIEQEFNFEKKKDFIFFIYSVWEEAIDHTYKQFGALLLSQQRYYKTRNKLYKKYYKKI